MSIQESIGRAAWKAAMKHYHPAAGRLNGVWSKLSVQEKTVWIRIAEAAVKEDRKR